MNAAPSHGIVGYVNAKTRDVPIASFIARIQPPQKVSALSAPASPIGDTKPCGRRRAAHYRFFGPRCRAYGVCPPPPARRWSRPADTTGDEIAGVWREGDGTRALCHAPI